MRFAIIGNNKHQLPFKGAKGVCPACGETVIAKCGSIKVHHWSHQSNSNCKYKENKGEWHLKWQMQFEDDWQECQIKNPNTNEINIADIKTQNGFVIEFQHSSISEEERKARENFYCEKQYGNCGMIWVVDGSRLKNDWIRFNNKHQLPTQWLNSKVPVVFDFLGLEQTEQNNSKKKKLYYILPQDKQKYFTIDRDKFIKIIQQDRIKVFFHNKMKKLKYKFKLKQLQQYNCDISKYINRIKELFNRYKEQKRDNFISLLVKEIKFLEQLNWNETYYLKEHNICDTKKFRKINNIWYVKCREDILLKIHNGQNVRYPINYLLCPNNYNKDNPIEEYYNNILNNKNNLVYKGNAYAGGECSGKTMAVFMNEEKTVLYILCREEKGTFIYDYSNSKWKMPTNNVSSHSYNLIKVIYDNGYFIHEHDFNLYQHKSFANGLVYELEECKHYEIF